MCPLQIILVGIEAHVCMLQTSLDLLERGYEVHLVVDGTSSQYLADRAVGIQARPQAGMLLFRACCCLLHCLAAQPWVCCARSG